MSEKYTYEKDVSGDKKLENSLRQIINNWAGSIPHHPFKKLGDDITVKSIWYKPAYPIQLRTQFEERSKHKGHEPFVNQKIPEQKYFNLSDFNSWDISLKKIPDFEDSVHKYYVSGSQHVENCFHCHARGWITCHTCNGNTTITCRVCNGNKKINCRSCGGRGDNSCSSCGGSGQTSRQVSKTKQVWVNSDSGGYYRTDTYYETVRERCNSCGGRGRKTCNTCSGTGKVTCTGCSGKGYVTCPTCRGSGRITCTICKGHMQLMHHFYIERKLECSDQRTCIIHDEIYDNFPQYLDEFSEYELKSLFNNKANRVNKDQLPEGHFLNAHINKFIDQAKADETTTHCMQFQEVDISCIDTWELRYRFKGKDYVMAFTGSNYDIIPGLSPVYEVAYDYWEKGVSASRILLYSRAARFLNKALKIDVFEIKKKIETAIDQVNAKITQSYKFGTTIAFWLIAFLGGFFAYSYYSDVNYVMGYADVINKPDNFLYDYHAWTQTLFSIYLIYLAYKLSNRLVHKFGRHIPSAFLRVISGALIMASISSLFMFGWGLINATGISIVFTFFAWLVVKIIKIILIVLGFMLGIIVLAVEVVWGILKWLFGLFA